MNWKDITTEQYEQWAATKRQDYQRGQISPEMVASCESIPGWRWEKKRKDALPFEDARRFVHSLGLKSQQDWWRYCKSGNRPPNIPAAPTYAYDRGRGWAGWIDWLGIRERWSFRPFEQARAFARSLGLSKQKEWKAYIKLNTIPYDIPKYPEAYYKKHKGWVSWGDWLGTGKAKRTACFLPFEEARAMAQSLNLSSAAQYQAKRPKNLPRHPDNVYAGKPPRAYAGKGWISWGDWLGTNNVRTKTFLPFEEARAFVQTLNLKNQRGWSAYCTSGERLQTLPSHPSTHYAGKGWVSWGDWLGTNSVYKKTFLPFPEARAFVQSLGLKTQKQWWTYATSKRPADIPATPNKVYADKGWVSWGDWLGTGNTFGGGLPLRRRKTKAAGA